jgi:hypothetical protein
MATRSSTSSTAAQAQKPQHPMWVFVQCTTRRDGQSHCFPCSRHLHQAVEAARAEQATSDWKQRYTIRAGVEGAIHQVVAVTGVHRSRYVGLAKTHLARVLAATAINLVRLDAWWTGHPLDRTRTSHLAALDPAA